MAYASIPSDEEILYRRILFEGDQSHDKRIMLVRKNFNKLCQDACSKAKAPPDDISYQKYLVLLSQIALANEKNKLVHENTDKQIQRYDEQVKDIEVNIKDVQDQVEVCKKSLAEAKIIHQNKLKYDAIAQNITEYPSRKFTAKKLAEARAELKDLQQTGRDLEAKTKMRKKQFNLLMSCVNDMRDFLEEEKSGRTRNKVGGGDSNDNMDTS